MIPSTAPLPAGWVDAIWRATKAHAITWEDAQHLQDMALPRCLRHNEPIKVTDGGGQCVRCVEEAVGVIHEMA
jgi:hypothetical protein